MGVLGNFRDSVTIINRTIGAGAFEQDLNVRFDGEDITLKPGENHGFPKVAIPYARKQNPLKGSKHNINPNVYISLIGVKGSKDDCTPIPESVLATAAGKYSVNDLDGSFYGDPERPVKLLRKSGFSPYEAAVGLPSEFDVNKNID